LKVCFVRVSMLGPCATIGHSAASHYNQIYEPSPFSFAPLQNASAWRHRAGGALSSLAQRSPVSVQVQLRDGETIDGWIEYFDDCMVRITRDGHPNLFIYKHQIRTITETPRRR
jgi:sRNA-binding regulator protein Hfq